MATKPNPKPVTTPATTTPERVIVIRHKADGKPSSKPTKAAIAATLAALKLARVARPSLVEFFTSGQFHAMPMIPQAIIDNPERLWEEFGTADTYWIVPADSLGRAPKNGERDWDSTAQSILLWIKKHMAETPKPLVRASELSVTVVRTSELPRLAG